MRKIIAYEFLSIDGYFAGPSGHEMDWVKDRVSDDIARDIARQYDEIGAFIMGRTTYAELAGYWPYRTTKEEPLADYMNSIEKLVCSTRAGGTNDWGPSRVLGGDITKNVQDLKQQPGKDCMIIGSGSIVRHLATARLIDEFRFLVFPVVLGSGKRLFDGIPNRFDLRTTRVHRFDNGVLAVGHATVETR